MASNGLRTNANHPKKINLSFNEPNSRHFFLIFLQIENFNRRASVALLIVKNAFSFKVHENRLGEGGWPAENKSAIRFYLAHLVLEFGFDE